MSEHLAPYRPIDKTKLAAHLERFKPSNPPWRFEYCCPPGFIEDDEFGGYVESVTKFAKRITYDRK